MHIRRMYTYKMHGRETHAYKTIAHHCFGGSLPQTVVDFIEILSFQKYEFLRLNSYGVVPYCLSARAVCGQKSASLRWGPNRAKRHT